MGSAGETARRVTRGRSLHAPRVRAHAWALRERIPQMEIETRDVLCAMAFGLFCCIGWWPIVWVICKVAGWL